MKTTRVSDNTHRELARLLGEMMAKTGKTQTYNDVVPALIAQSIFLPAELLQSRDVAINANKQLGYVTRGEFVDDAVREMLQNLSSKVYK